jgi:hypothetical protein
LEDAGVDGRIISRWVFRKWGMDWIDVAQDRALVTAIMKLWVPYNAENLTS